MLPGSPGEWWKVPVTVQVSQKKDRELKIGTKYILMIKLK